MHEFIESAEDVVAVKVSGKITAGNLGAIMDRLESVMGRHKTVHVFVESHAIDGIELSALPSYAARAMPLFGELSRFGRVAVVADQAWVRFGTELESMILPGVEYRVFEPDERERALGWVEGMIPDEAVDETT